MKEFDIDKNKAKNYLTKNEGNLQKTIKFIINN